jgi:hypothetical protein
LVFEVLPRRSSSRWRSRSSSAFFREALSETRSACSTASSSCTSRSPVFTVSPDSKAMRRTMPPTCGAISVPCTALKVPMAGSLRPQLSCFAGAAETVVGGGVLWASMLWIICGLATNWK